MSKYGSAEDSTGKKLQGSNNQAIVRAGERNPGYKLISFGIGQDQEGNEVPNRADFVWENPTGGKFKPSVFDWNGEDDTKWQFDNLRNSLLHVAKAMATEEQWYAAVKDKNDFASYIAAASAFYTKHSAGKTFTLKIRYNKNDRLAWPNFPDFIEIDGTDPAKSKLSTDPRYDFYVKSTNRSSTAAPKEGQTAEVDSDLPF